MQDIKAWEKIRQLGTGGQSTVHLVRSPQRVAERAKCLAAIDRTLNSSRHGELALAIANYSREDKTAELGALKEFDKVRRDGATPEERIRREIEILGEGHANLPKLLDNNADEKWLVTEYFPNGVLESSPDLFKGDGLKALKAFRPLVETISRLHDAGVIHRDRKPANVFVANDGGLVLGDFGIAFKPEQSTRLTVTHERVGPWDYMPQWADTGNRLDEVRVSFDIYMLGKLLWCMISGRFRLPREYHRRDEYDLSRMFPDDRSITAVNSLLDACIVEHEGDCLQSSKILLKLVDEIIHMAGKGLFRNADGEVELPCLVCGRGVYREETKSGRVNLLRYTNENVQQGTIFVRLFTCSVCTHRAFFAPGYPNEAAITIKH